MSNPTTHVEPFDGSMGDFTGVDPIRYDEGSWLEEATTNLLPNPTAASNLTGWTAATGATVTRDTSEYNIGSTSVKIVTPGDSSLEGVVTLYTAVLTGAADKFTASVYLKGTGSIDVWIRTNYSDVTFVETAKTHVTLTGEWVRAVVEAATLNPAKTTSNLTLMIRTPSAQAITAYAANAQIEKKPYATSYADSSLGSGYSASPSPHSRAASSAAISPAGILTPSAGAIAMRVTPIIETAAEEVWGECGVKGAGTDHLRWGRDATKHPFVEWSANNASYQRLTASETINALASKTIYFGWSGTTAYLQVDSGSLQSASRDAVSASWGAGNLILEASKGGNVVSSFSTYSEHLAAYDRALVIAEIAAGGAHLLTVLDDAAAPLRTLNVRTNALLRR